MELCPVLRVADCRGQGVSVLGGGRCLILLPGYSFRQTSQSFCFVGGPDYCLLQIARLGKQSLHLNISQMNNQINSLGAPHHKIEIL